ncbi:phosphotransferase enzyme family protein [Algoriphagus limi]|uniref:Aminoglycoside phosphotransferase family protein n=1 Tax=Algoriphagus limi TaxID=2975273 RepID=A0ABT2G6M9_9BACT|nr:aminoglycoside phosphotransferase family protein [Algoriphagus limi]MCS5490920.1 aminoglycoside phosphotransferase family protein [Algoriphagus limi]
MEPLGNGLIHETWKISNNQGEFVLQAYNKSVFPYPERIQNNLDILFREQVAERLPFELPLPIQNSQGEQLTNFEGKLWRIFPFVSGKTLEQIQVPNEAWLAAKAFGEFASAGKELNMSEFMETIPDFHRLDLRFEKFQQTASAVKTWTKEEEDILRFYLNQKPLIEEYKVEREKLPIRLTHSDTKINNLIFSEDLHQIKALIDLDTVMPGLLLYDFGDLVRTIACSLSETSIQWEGIRLQEEIFEELILGYLEGIKNLATQHEFESLLIGGEVMTCMMGLRFFTDHLQGNIYYRVQYPEQNLHRAKNQMILLRDQQEKRAQLRNIWKKSLEKVRACDN